MIQLYNGLAIPVIFLHCGNPSSLTYTGNNSSHLFIISPPPTNPLPPPLPPSPRLPLCLQSRGK